MAASTVDRSAPADNRVLVVGVYMADRQNTADAIATELAASRHWRVDQRWMALGKTHGGEWLETITAGRALAPHPKFTLMNQLLSAVAIHDYRFILVCDDDISVPPGFLDSYLAIVLAHDFALSQPARTWDSHIDHSFVARMEGLTARRTRFVEIGPLFVVRRDAVPTMIPFDEASPMGWGYDLTWPYRLESVGLKLGIVDETPVCHVLRPPVLLYDRRASEDEMRRFLARRPHLTREDAFVIVEAYA